VTHRYPPLPPPRSPAHNTNASGAHGKYCRKSALPRTWCIVLFRESEAAGRLKRRRKRLVGRLCSSPRCSSSLAERAGEKFTGMTARAAAGNAHGPGRGGPQDASRLQGRAGPPGTCVLRKLWCDGPSDPRSEEHCVQRVRTCRLISDRRVLRWRRRELSARDEEVARMAVSTWKGLFGVPRRVPGE